MKQTLKIKATASGAAANLTYKGVNVFVNSPVFKKTAFEANYEKEEDRTATYDSRILPNRQMVASMVRMFGVKTNSNTIECDKEGNRQTYSDKDTCVTKAK